ncbi:iron uptake protein [Massilia sp. SR12]
MNIVLRVLGAVAGGYGVCALAVATAAALLARLGMVRSEAVMLSAMLGFLAYLGLLLWAFSIRSTARLWLYLLAGAVVMAGLQALLR